jgi:hypothetical protein
MEAAREAASTGESRPPRMKPKALSNEVLELGEVVVSMDLRVSPRDRECPTGDVREAVDCEKLPPSRVDEPVVWIRNAGVAPVTEETDPDRRAGSNAFCLSRNSSSVITSSTPFSLPMTEGGVDFEMGGV